MKNKKLLVLVIILALFLSSKTYAQDICSKNGYTVLTINGIFTDKEGAILNKNALRYKLSPTYNNQPILVDYVYNATHFGGAFDLADAVRQGLFDSGLDYDLVEMLDSASDKVTTQKILLVGHSQGNFYANSFYNKVADIEGGVPSQSIGVYAVATPDDHVAGDGKYLTSDTDSIIATIVGRLKNIMKPNIHIELQKVDGAGHDFSNVYLKYRNAEIVSDIKSSFDNLEINNIQNENVTCISPQKISILHDLTRVLLAATDFVVSSGVKVATLHFNITNKATNSFVNTLVKIAKKGMAAVGFADNKEITPIIVEAVDTEIIQENNSVMVIDPPVEVIIDDVKINNPIINDIAEDILVPDIVPESSHSHNNSNNDKEIIIPEIIVPEIATSEVIVPEIIIPETATSEKDADIPDITPPVITLIGKDFEYLAAQIHYVDTGVSAFDDIDGDIPVLISVPVRDEITKNYVVTYTAIDKAGNISTKIRTMKFSTYVYSDKYTFGTGNGDGKDWEIWYFNNSAVFNWSDTYVNKYLREEFKIEAYHGSFESSGLMRGVFYHDPKKGFNSEDLHTSSFQCDVYNNGSGLTYNAVIQWDATGYSLEVSSLEGEIICASHHYGVSNINNDTWVGWTGWGNYFRQPISGSWIGVSGWSKSGLVGGTNMVLTPYLVYDESQESEDDEEIIVSIPSSEKSITSFSFDSLTPKVNGVINETNHTILLTVPYETDIENLIPTIVIPEKATISSNSLFPQDFTNPVSFVVTAEDKTTQTYVATVIILDDPLPIITSYTFNGNQSAITINPITNNLTIVLTANKDVDWMSVYIQQSNNSSFYTAFGKGEGCSEFTKTCTKVWNGILSSDGLVKNGPYMVRVHMHDESGNFYEKYLPLWITVVGQESSI